MRRGTTSSDRLSIGQLARRAGLRPSALRYYESVGILPPPVRIGGQRRYDPGVLDSLELIRLAKDAGFTIAEIRRLSQGFDRTTPASARWRQLATRKREVLAQRIARAQRMQHLLDALLACECVELEDCPRRCAPDRDGARSVSLKGPVSRRHASSP
jgi:MerR family transcriptional regulator, redox-sensitive transcriptional activator SoxR